MAYIVDPSGGAGSHDDVHTSQLNPLGAVRMFSDGNSYIYLKGATSMAANNWVTFREGEFTAIRMVAGAKGSCAVAMAAVDASTKYGWFGFVGSFTATADSTIVSNAHCFATGTASQCDDAVVKNDQIKNARTTTAGAAAKTVTVSINRPYLGSYDESA